MPRPLRIDYPGAVHHVMNRGADHQAIFLSDHDRRDFTSLWEEAVTRFGIVVIAYAWMGNHYHALVICPDGQLSETLRHIGYVYTQRFNRRHGRDGALFRGRFRSILVDSNEYLKRVARYIERNPIEAGLTQPAQLANYRWSSLNQYLNPSPSNWVTTTPLLGELGSRHAYWRYVLSDLSDHELLDFYSQEGRPRAVLGKRSFVDSLPARALELNPVAGIPERSLDELDHAIENVLGKFDPSARELAVQLGRRLGHASRTALATRYGYPSEGSVSQVTHKASRHTDLELLRNEVLNYLRNSDGV